MMEGEIPLHKPSVHSVPKIHLYNRLDFFSSTFSCASFRLLIVLIFFFFFFGGGALFFFILTCLVKSKETVGNSWTVLKVILGHK